MLAEADEALHHSQNLLLTFQPRSRGTHGRSGHFCEVPPITAELIFVDRTRSNDFAVQKYFCTNLLSVD